MACRRDDVLVHVIPVQNKLGVADDATTTADPSCAVSMDIDLPDRSEIVVITDVVVDFLPQFPGTAVIYAAKVSCIHKVMPRWLPAFALYALVDIDQTGHNARVLPMPQITFTLVVLQRYVVLIGIDIQVLDLLLPSASFLLRWELQVMDPVHHGLLGHFLCDACRHSAFAVGTVRCFIQEPYDGVFRHPLVRFKAEQVISQVATFTGLSVHEERLLIVDPADAAECGGFVPPDDVPVLFPAEVVPKVLIEPGECLAKEAERCLEKDPGATTDELCDLRWVIEETFLKLHQFRNAALAKL